VLSEALGLCASLPDVLYAMFVAGWRCYSHRGSLQSHQCFTISLWCRSKRQFTGQGLNVCTQLAVMYCQFEHDQKFKIIKSLIWQRG